MDIAQWLWVCLVFCPLVSYLTLQKVARFWRGLVCIVCCTVLTAAIGETLPQGQMWSVFACSVCWMLSVQLVSLVLRPDFPQTSLWSFTKSMLYVVFPVTRFQPRLTAPGILFDSLSSLTIYAVKFITAHVLHHLLIFCMDRDFGPEGGQQLRGGSPWLILQYNILLIVLMWALTFSTDINRALLAVLSWGRYSLVAWGGPDIFLATSPRDFWGRRWNRLFYSVVHSAVFTPLFAQGKGVLSARWAALSVFLFSGALHMHVVHVAFRGPVLPTLVFFLLHGAACSLQPKWWQDMPLLVQIPVTMALLAATTPLYVDAVYACPEILKSYVLSPPLPQFLTPLLSWAVCPRLQS